MITATAISHATSYRPGFAAPRRFASLAALILAAVTVWSRAEQPPVSPSPGAQSTGLPLPMMLDPVLEQPTPEVTFDRRNVTLWLAALERPEFDLRIEAIEAFAIAHRRGVDDLQEALPAIEGLLARDPHPDVRFAAARTLIEFDHRAAAPLLQSSVVDVSKAPIALIIAVDNALARWNHAPAVAMWIERLKARREHPSAAASAVQSLAKVRAKDAGDAIMGCVRDRNLSPSLRLEAARALPLVEAAGRSEQAAILASEPAPWGPLMALLALGSADDAAGTERLDADSIRLADSLTFSHDARVRSHAVALLRRANLQLVTTKVDLVNDPDEQVRLEIIRAFAAAPPTQLVVATLAGALDDVSEPVRDAARRALVSLGSSASTAAPVAGAIDIALSRGRWREAQQAAILAGELNSKSAAERLAALLNSDRAEVRLAAACSLRMLHVPASLPALLVRAKELSASAAQAAKDPPRFESVGQETTQIFMAFADGRYRESVELLKTYIPKRSGFHPLARGAAIYALGKILESQPDAALAELLLARAADDNPLDPEAAEVRRFSAITLARMGARSALPTLRELYEAENTTVSVGGACRWAIMHLEGIDLPPCRPVVTKAGPFFLESIEAVPPSGSP